MMKLHEAEQQFFSNGKIMEEVPAGEERVLLFEEKGE